MTTSRMNTDNFPANQPATRSRYLLLGICGSGMTALSEILTDLGHHVMGADHSLTPQEIATADRWTTQPTLVPWHADAVPIADIDICVVTPAIPSDDALLMCVAASDIPVLTLHECLAELFANQHQVCVAGTHGKTTTAAMLSWILGRTGRAPSCFIGGRVSGMERSGQVGSGDAVILESCEFSESFHHFRPRTAVITGIERDHFDCFPSVQDEDNAFQRFVEQLDDDGALILNADCDRSKKLAQNHNTRIITFGIDSTACDWCASNVRVRESVTEFSCRFQGRQFQVRLKVPGHHNARNALAAMAAATQLGVTAECAAQAIESFGGVNRRFETRGVINGVTFIDDYGHHPTAVRETLRTARSVFPGRRVVLVFEPHQVVRTQALANDFIDALKEADEILLLPVFPAREKVAHTECCRISGNLVRELNSKDCRAFLFANLDQIVSRIDHSARPSDVYITMGAGRTHLIYDQITQRLRRHSVA